jgi:DNA-binding transcriptional ArsR family regulator
MAKYRNNSFDAVVALAKALGDPARLRALAALREGELCACQVTELLGLAPSTVSKHMSILRQAGLVTCRKAGRWCFFSLADGGASPEARSAIAWLGRALAAAPEIEQDRRLLKKILNTDPEELCRKQCHNC